MPIVNVIPCSAGDPRLGQPATEAERVDRRGRLRGAPLGRRGTRLVGEEQRHLQPGGRVVAGEREHADEQVRIVVEPGQRVFQLVRDLRRERVLLLDPVDGQHEDVLVDHLGADLAVRVTFPVSH